MDNLKIDRTKLITQARYADLKKVSRSRINQMVKRGQLKTVIIEGATLIYLD